MTKDIRVTFYGPETNGSDIGQDPFDNQNGGSKGIAFMTNSTVQIVGRVRGDGLAWTQLASTAFNGSKNILLMDRVSWTVGDSIVVASTDFGEVIDKSLNPSLQVSL